jgi:hypothetical protein
MDIIEKRGRRWRVRYRDVDGVMVAEAGFASKAEAQQWIIDNPWPDDGPDEVEAHGVG